jgi:hypothetical protein
MKKVVSKENYLAERKVLWMAIRLVVLSANKKAEG